MSDRLHKVLAQHGFGSRREIERWLTAGRILINGKPASPGHPYQPGDRVVVDGRDVSAQLKSARAPRVLVYNKPPGQPLARSTDEALDESGTVQDRLPRLRGSRWLAINRMTAGDSGLLLMTTDGQLADVLMRRATHIPTSFAVRVLMPEHALEHEPPTSVLFDEERIEFSAVEATGGEGHNRWYHVELARADRRAAVRALFESRGWKVSRVIQLSYAAVELPRDLPRGRHRELTEAESALLYEAAGLRAPSDREEADSRDNKRASKSSRRPAKTKRSHTTGTRRARR